MTSVLSSVTSWLGGSRERSPERSADEVPSANTPVESTTRPADTPVTAVEESKSESTTASPTKDPSVDSADQAVDSSKEAEDQSAISPMHSIDVDLQELSEKTLNAAKEWGSYLFSYGKAATEQVVKTAMQLKDTVEEKTMIGEFSREQEKFVSENREKKKQSEAAVPPWVGYNEEEIMKSQILALSKDKRNFMRNPPAGVQFYFDYETSFPIALVMLEEDPNLKKMRFELVPKQIKEDMFWRNYFYRVSLIKQSTQLTSLVQQTGTMSEMPSRSSKTDLAAKTAKPDHDDKDGDELTVGSPPTDHEFVSDSFQAGDLNDEELEKEMHQLGVADDTHGDDDDVPEWERELQAELQEYEVVDDGSNLDDAELEHEILKEIEAESKHT